MFNNSTTEAISQLHGALRSQAKKDADAMWEKHIYHLRPNPDDAPPSSAMLWEAYADLLCTALNYSNDDSWSGRSNDTQRVYAEAFADQCQSKIRHRVERIANSEETHCTACEKPYSSRGGHHGNFMCKQCAGGAKAAATALGLPVVDEHGKECE